jgi:photosystem II stability/assembly factor-like uncharacterized protein
MVLAILASSVGQRYSALIVSRPPRAPESPPADQLEALIEEARRRALRRRLSYALAALAAVGLALGIAFGAGHGGRHAASAPPAVPPPSGTRQRQQIERIARRATIVEAGLVAPGLGWAMNGLGLWLTEDGGLHWRPIAPPPVLAIGDVVARVDQIVFADRRDAWISASDIRGSTILRNGSTRHFEIERTTDGGRTWQSVIPPGCAICGGGYLSFLDVRRGYALTGAQPEPRLYATADGGKSWRLIARPPFSGPIVFVDPGRGFGVVGGTLYRTLDGGRRWRAVALAVPRGYAGERRTINAPRFFGARDGVFPARYLDPGTRKQSLVVYTTGDGGSTWSPHIVPRQIDLHAYSFGFAGARIPFSAPSATTWVVFADRVVYHATEAGRKWTRVGPRWAPRPPGVWDVDFTSGTNGWAIFGTRDGVALVRTSDGGRDWSPLAPPVPRFPAPRQQPSCGSGCRRP